LSRWALDSGGTALYQAILDPVAEKFASDADTRWTRPNDAEIALDELIAWEFSCIPQHRRMPPLVC